MELKLFTPNLSLHNAWSLKCAHNTDHCTLNAVKTVHKTLNFFTVYLTPQTRPEPVVIYQIHPYFDDWFWEVASWTDMAGQISPPACCPQLPPKTASHHPCPHPPSDSQTVREAERKTVRQSDSQKFRQSDSQGVRQSDSKTARQSDSQTVRQ